MTLKHKTVKQKTLSTLAVLAAGLGGISTTAHAQKLSPGLWEITMEMKTAGGEAEAGMAKMQAELAKLPPDQRKQVEAMMAQRGVSMGAAPGGGKGMAIKTCISKERAERGDVPDAKDPGNCKREGVERSGATTKFKIVCSNPPSTGTGEFTFKSDKAFSGKMVFDSERKGKPERMEMQQQGQWLNADCGALKPQ